MKLRYGRWTVIEVEAGIVLVGLVGYVICGLFFGLVSPEALGFLIGIFGAMLWFYSMALSMESSLDMGSSGTARKHSMKMHGLRVLMIILVTAIVSRLETVNVVAALLALFSVKAAVYLQPLMHKLFCHWFHLTDELSPDALYLPEEDEEDDDGEGEKPDRIDRWMERLYRK